MPHPYIFQVPSVGEVIATSQDQTILLMRSKIRGSSGVSEEWLPDTFIAQLFCNSKALTVGGLEDKTVGEISLLELLPVFITSNRGAGGSDPVVIDGTSVLQSIFDPGSKAPLSTSRGNTAGENGGTLYLGTLDLSLAVDVDEGDGYDLISRVQIVEAPWPPVYVLETVATPTGIVLVNNVNCGYLDLAINLLRSVRNVSDAKVRRMKPRLRRRGFVAKRCIHSLSATLSSNSLRSSGARVTPRPYPPRILDVNTSCSFSWLRRFGFLIYLAVQMISFFDYR